MDYSKYWNVCNTKMGMVFVTIVIIQFFKIMSKIINALLELLLIKLRLWQTIRLFIDLWIKKNANWVVVKNERGVKATQDNDTVLYIDEKEISDPKHVVKGFNG